MKYLKTYNEKVGEDEAPKYDDGGSVENIVVTNKYEEFDSEVFNDNIIYDEYLRRMKKDTVIINENKNNRLISFFKKLKLNNYNG
jgi:hypothetical protein